MLPFIAGTTVRLPYVAEMRDGSGVVTASTNVKLKIRNVTDATWWTGAAWGVETELTATHLAAGAWYYDLAIPAADAGDILQWVFYDETDGTVVQSELARVLPAGAIAISMPAGANPVTITLTASGVAVAGAFCVIRNAAETVAMRVGVTDANGQIEAQLDDGTYAVRFGAGLALGGLAHGYDYDNPYTLTVSGTTSAAFTCTALAAPPGGLTFQEMRDQLDIIALKLLGDERRYVSAVALGRWVNSAYHEIDRKLRWTRCTYEFTTVADQDVYVIPSSVREYLAVSYTDDADQVRDLEPMSLGRMVALQAALGTDSGDPSRWAFHGDRFYLYPPPETAGETVKVWTVGEPPKLSNDDDKPGFPAHLHELVVDQAIVYLLRHFGQLEAATKLDQYIEAKIAAERLEPAIERTGPERIEPPPF